MIPRSLATLLALVLVQGARAQTLLASYPGNSAFDRMQVSAGGRDLNGDGVDDFLVAAPNDGANAGIVYAYAGGTGALLWTAQGDDGDQFGHALLLIDDITSDGVADVLVGAPGAALAGQATGVVRFLSGASGAECFDPCRISMLW